jgi:hypothetical protein
VPAAEAGNNQMWTDTMVSAPPVLVADAALTIDPDLAHSHEGCTCTSVLAPLPESVATPRAQVLEPGGRRDP